MLAELPRWAAGDGLFTSGTAAEVEDWSFRVEELPEPGASPEPERITRTPFPWTVRAHPDTCGAYTIAEAAGEQEIWPDEAFARALEPELNEAEQMAWDNEGQRRAAIAGARDKGNRRLIEALPELLSALDSVAWCLENWVELAPEEDRRDYDEAALEKARALLRRFGDGR